MQSEVVMEKKFYTFEEILLALRGEYLKHQELLEELKNYLYIENNEIESFYFQSHRKTLQNGNVVYNPKLSLVIVEKLKKLQRIREKIMVQQGYSPSQNKAFYEFKQDESKNFSCDLEFKGKLVSIKPIFTITNQKEFNELINEILNTDFMKLVEERTFKSMIGDWRFLAYTSFMELGNSRNKILYFADQDTIKFRGVDYQDYAKRIIRYPIHEYYIRDDLKKMIDKNLKEDQIIEIDEYSFNEKETNFEIVDSDNGIKLIKTKKYNRK